MGCGGAAEDRLFARPDKPSRCTLPITALRLTLPSSAAIWLAESPAPQSFFNCSTRLWDQVKTGISPFPRIAADNSWSRAAMPSFKKPRPQNPLRLAGHRKRARTFTPVTKGERLRAMSSDRLNLQFSWTLAQEYSWFKLYALFFMGYPRTRAEASSCRRRSPGPISQFAQVVHR